MSSEQIQPGLPEEQGRGAEPMLFCTRLYLLFLQGLFKQFPEGSFKWSDDERLSEIAITDQAPFPRERIVQRPAIVTQRGPFKFANLSLDNVREVDPKTGAKVRTDLIACTMQIHCISKTGLEAQRIGWIVMRHIRSFKELLQRNGLAKVGDDLDMTGETPPGTLIQPEADNEATLVTVQSPFFFQWTERTTPTDAPRLREIEMHVTAALGTGPAMTTPTKVLRYPQMLGRTLGPSAPIDSESLGFTVKS